MFITLQETTKKIENGELLHIAGTEALLKKLPKGNWIGGSTEYYMTENGGKVSGEMLFVTEFARGNFIENFKIQSYDDKSVCKVTEDSFDSGFTILIVPFDSKVHKEYAQNAAGYRQMFLKTIAGWIAGVNLNKQGQTPIAVDGLNGEAFSDKAVALHLQIPQGKTVSVNIINIFEQDKDSPLIEFSEEGFAISKCLVNGKEEIFADYITKNNIDTKLPLVGDYSGTGVNVSFKSIDDGVVHLYAPVFKGINYRMAKIITNYADLLNTKLTEHKETKPVFSCNCILNFLYGELENKKIDSFTGPITFGEIAYQLVNQTLVYLTV